MQRGRWQLILVFRWIVFLCLLCRHAVTFTAYTSTKRTIRSLVVGGPLCGIRGFRAWLDSKFPDSITKINKAETETFDHVLVDLNQFLHAILRRSRNDDHGLVLLIKELDEILRLSTPTKTLVLAIDGPPSAAKLATQRKRRYDKFVKAEAKLRYLERLVESNHTSLRPNQQLIARRKKGVSADTRTLSITPGTEFMSRVEDALLYWVWQRMSNKYSTLSKGIKVYISPSTVPGEGEVKLLEWIYNRPRNGESIAFLGGDADLVLEGLAIPVSITHNVFVLLPEGKRGKYLSVSLWEMTRVLAGLVPNMTLENMMNYRLDLVLLVILTGNDYVPKLRGSNGFNYLFQSYIRLQRHWISRGAESEAFLVDPYSLDFNIDFCIEFFEDLAGRITPFSQNETNTASPYSPSSSPLQKLHHHVQSGFLPSPMEFQVVGADLEDSDPLFDEDDDVDEEHEEDTSLDTLDESESGYEEGEDDETDDDQLEVVLMLGHETADNFLKFSQWMPRSGKRLKAVKQELARVALDEILEESDLEDGLPFDENFTWQSRKLVQSQTDDYLYGLLWTLQTYQDGICADYGFNYGYRLAPDASDVLNYLLEAKANGTQVGVRTLQSRTFSKPVTAGISCLAALPTVVKNIIPVPYRYLDDEFVELAYEESVDNTSNTFDVKYFEDKCNREIDRLSMIDEKFQIQPKVQPSKKGRRILMGHDYWTTISLERPGPRSFQAPPPFADRLSYLRPNDRIHASRTMSKLEPNLRPLDKPKSFKFAGSATNIDQVSYHRAFLGQKKSPQQMPRKKKAALNAVKRKVEPKPKALPETRDGLTPASCLKQLQDAKLIGRVRWIVHSIGITDELEHWRLEVAVGSSTGRKLRYETTRSQEASKKQVKHHLASLALGELTKTGEEWKKLSFREIKAILKPR